MVAEKAVERVDLLAFILPVSRELRRIEDAAAASAGVSMWQYAILWAISVWPGLNQAEVADRIGYSRNRIVADIDALEAAGLATRRPGADRRANVLHVTAEGRSVVERVRREIHRREDDLLHDVEPAERDALQSTLQKLAATVRRRRQ